MILCCGEALIDMLPTPIQDGQTAYVPHTGGAVFNTAIALGRLGIPSGLVTGLSNDFFGQMLEGQLHASGVDTSLAIRSNRPTTLAFVRLAEGKASYIFYDENSAGRMVQPGDLPTLPDAATALFCGGISLVVEPGAEAFAALIERERGRQPIMFDPNIRPDFITDENQYRARLARVLDVCDIIKVSDEDLGWLIPSHSSIEHKIGMLKGPSIKIVTEGSGKAMAFLANGSCVEMSANKVEVADTVGAGDTFNAGLLCHLTRTGMLNSASLKQLTDTEMQNALRFAHDVAAITVSRKGANPPWAAELPDIDCRQPTDSS